MICISDAASSTTTHPCSRAVAIRSSSSSTAQVSESIRSGVNTRRLAVEVAALAALTVAVYTGTALGVAMFGDGAGFPFWPALAAGVLVTTLTDVLGFLFFLGLATLLVESID